MNMIETAHSFTITRQTFIPSTRRALLSTAAFVAMISVGHSSAQIAQLLDSHPSSPSTISKNQLLAPGKAKSEVQRARKDILAGHLQSAQSEIARALHIDPHFGVAEALRAALDLNDQNYEQAAARFQQAMQDDPVLGVAYAGMAVVLIHQGRYQAALPLLDRAEGLVPGAWLVHFAHAWAHLETGDLQAAARHADDAERLAANNPERTSGVSYLRAMLCIRLNDLEKARQHLGEAVARDPGGDYSEFAKKELEKLPPASANRR